MMSKDQQLLEEAYKSVLNNTSSSIDNEVKNCEDIIKKLATGEFKNEPDEIIQHVKKCSHVFSVTQDNEGQYTVIIKDSALPVIEKMYPELAGKFKSAKDCKKDTVKCREDKLS